MIICKFSYFCIYMYIYIYLRPLTCRQELPCNKAVSCGFMGTTRRPTLPGRHPRMALNPWVRVRWFGDADCERFLSGESWEDLGMSRWKSVNGYTPEV